VGEDGEEDAIHGGAVLEDTHGSGAAPDLAEAPLDGIGGSHALALCGPGRAGPAGDGAAAGLGQRVRSRRRRYHTIAYSQGEGSLQALLGATGPIHKNRPSYLPILFPLPVACGAVDGRWVVTRNPGQLEETGSQN
jgi:hypothetical protein